MEKIDLFLNNLGEGWTIYIWLVSGVAIVVAAMIGVVWAAKNDQFDEDIKYLVFTESDKKRMDPEEYKKSREVVADQMQKRDEFLEKKYQERQKQRS